MRRQARQEKEELRNTVRLQVLQAAQEQQQAGGGEGAEESVSESTVVAEMTRVEKLNACLAYVGGESGPGGSEGAAQRGGGRAAAPAPPTLTVLSRAELQQAEFEIGMQAELQASSGLDAQGSDLTDAQMDRTAKRKVEMRRRCDTLPSARTAAAAQLTAAVASADLGELKAAVAAGRAAVLEGNGAVDGVGGESGWWVATEMRDAYVALQEAEKAAAEREAGARRREATKALCVRSLPLGTDRFGRRHWAIDPSLIGAQSGDGGGGGGGGGDGDGDGDGEEGEGEGGVQYGRGKQPYLGKPGGADGGDERCMVWVQPPTAELINVVRRPPHGHTSGTNGVGGGAGGAVRGDPTAAAPTGGDDDDSDDDDVPLSSIAAKASPMAKPSASPLAPTQPVDVPVEDGWALYEGENTCRAATDALDDRGIRERALKAEMHTRVDHVAARREMRTREAERARVERERNAREIAAASAAASAAANAAASAAAAAAASLQLYPQS